MKLIYILLAFFAISCTSSIRFSGEEVNNQSGNGSNKVDSKVNAGYSFKGKASYYGDKYDGRKTASGEVFDQDELTAAHRTLPFGTKCKVTNLKNGKSVEVKINDRGPFIKNRVIDLSKAAAKKIDMIKEGVVEVEVTILE